jgi:RimJ/RimL family protein N-acetyltransferase
MADDLDHLFVLDNDPQVMRYINGGIPVSRSAIQREILPLFLQYDDHNPVFGFWAAEDKNKVQFLGWFSLRPTGNDPGEAALGYRLRRDAWGQGYATEGVRALIASAFAQPGIQRIVATTYEDNLASLRVMEKAGMTLVRRFRLTPEEIEHADTFLTESLAVWDGDDLEYAISKSDWQRRSPFRPSA